MLTENKVKLTIDLLNHNEKNLICDCCSRPILVKDFDEIINLNYEDTPEFFKLHFKNEWINAYNNLNKSNLPLIKVPRRINILKWKNFIKKTNWISVCNQIIANLINNEELNLTDEDEKRFREELEELEKLEKLKSQQHIENSNTYSQEDSHNHSHQDTHKDSQEHNHEHSHNNSFEHNI